MKPKPRRQKLIRGSFQLQFVCAFVCLSALALLLQFLLLGFRVIRAAAELDGPGGELAEQVPWMLLQVFGFSLVVLMPVLYAIGVLMTHRIAGPIYRFERFLSDVAEGRESAPCRIRKSDRLHELCDLINRATEPARRQNDERRDPAPEAGDLRQAG